MLQAVTLQSRGWPGAALIPQHSVLSPSRSPTSAKPRPKRTDRALAGQITATPQLGGSSRSFQDVLSAVSQADTACDPQATREGITRMEEPIQVPAMGKGCSISRWIPPCQEALPNPTVMPDGTKPQEHPASQML